MITNDESVEIKLNSSRTRNIKKQRTKRKSRKNNTLKLKNRKHTTQNRKKIETLITNLPPETTTPTELKELYGER
jgi:hypothetical protein